jgi:hypothetical protein
MALTPLAELGVSEAYEILTGHFGIDDLPPLDSLENEDWGRDYLLGRLLELPRSALTEVGLCVSSPESGPSEETQKPEDRAPSPFGPP